MKKPAPTAAPKPPPTIWPDGGIGHPCGHESSFADGCLSRDRFACPTCGLNWRMVQDPPTVYPSGWVMPGKRRLELLPQMTLPNLTLATP